MQKREVRPGSRACAQPPLTSPARASLYARTPCNVQNHHIPHGTCRFAPDGQVEKSSYDDFYLDVTAACYPSAAGAAAGSPGGSGSSPGRGGEGGGGGRAGPAVAAGAAEAAARAWDDAGVAEADGDVGGSWGCGEHAGAGSMADDDEGGLAGRLHGEAPPPPPPRVHVAGGGQWQDLEPPLRAGVDVAMQLRAALKGEVGGLLVRAAIRAARMASGSQGPGAIRYVRGLDVSINVRCGLHDSRLTASVALACHVVGGWVYVLQTLWALRCQWVWRPPSWRRGWPAPPTSRTQ